VKRRLFILTSAASLLLCAATVALLCLGDHVLHSSPQLGVYMERNCITFAVHRRYSKVELEALQQSPMLSYQPRWAVAGVGYESFDRLFRGGDEAHFDPLFFPAVTMPPYDGGVHSTLLRISLVLPLLASLPLTLLFARNFSPDKIAPSAWPLSCLRLQPDWQHQRHLPGMRHPIPQTSRPA